MADRKKVWLLLGILIAMVVGMLLTTEAIAPGTEINACGAVFSAGTTYVLTQDVRNTPGSPCFILSGGQANNVVLDCQEHAIIADPTVSTDQGIRVGEYSTAVTYIVSDVTIKNCVITGFGMGINVYQAQNVLLENNVFSNNNVGIKLYKSTGVVTGATSCGNSGSSLQCGTETTFSGSRNFFNSVTACTGWPVSGTDYTTCGPDADSDGFPDTVDNCPATLNRDQADADADYIGDACDAGAVCVADSQCGQGLVCQAGFGGVQTCQESIIPCTVNIDCSADQECVAGRCEADADTDGVLYSNDRCPRTPSGKIVETDGCVIGDFSIPPDDVVDTSDITEANLQAKWVALSKDLVRFNQFIQNVRQNMVSGPN